MTISYVGNIGHANDKTAGTTISVTTTAGASVGDEVFAFIAYDNNNNTTADQPEIGRGSVADTRGNTWTEVASGEDASTDNRSYGGIFKTRVTTAIQTGDTITFTYVSSRTASAMTVEKFTSDRPLRLLKLRGALPRAQTGVPAISLDLENTMDGRQVLWIASASIESDNALSFTQDADYSAFTGEGTTGSTDATNQSIRGGYRITTGVSSDTYDADIGDAISRDMTQYYAAFVEVSDTLSLPVLSGGEGFRYLQTIGWGRSKLAAGAAAATSGLVDGVPAGTFVTVHIAWDAVNDITDTGPDDSTQQFTITDTAGNTWSRVAQAQNASATPANNAMVAIYASMITNAISAGDTLTVTQSNENEGRRHWTAHAWAVEGTPTFPDIEGRTHALNDATDPSAVTLSSLATDTVPYLFLWVMCAAGPDTDTYTYDSDYTTLVGVGGQDSNAGATNMKHVRSGYRILTATGDTVDVTSNTADRRYAQVFVALGTQFVNSFQPKVYIF